jgi:hypothetical protein
MRWIAGIAVLLTVTATASVLRAGDGARSIDGGLVMAAGPATGAAARAQGAPTLHCTTSPLPVYAPFDVLSVACSLDGAPATDTGFAVHAFAPDGQMVCEGALLEGSGRCEGTLPLLDAPAEPRRFFAITRPSGATAQTVAEPAGLALQCAAPTRSAGVAPDTWWVECALSGAPADDTWFSLHVGALDGPLVCWGALNGGAGVCGGTFSAPDEPMPEPPFCAVTWPGDVAVCTR